MLVSSTQHVFASEDISTMNQGNRPAINEYFDPDQSCLFDVFQLKCVPGSQQECPEGFASADPQNCYPRHPEGVLSLVLYYSHFSDHEVYTGGCT